MAKNKRVRKIRKSEEFSPARLRRSPKPPVMPTSAYSWDLPAIMNARDAQMRGQFRSAVQLASSMRTDHALQVARRNRLAPLRCLGIAITPGKGPRAGAIAGEGEALFGADGVAISRDTTATINGDLADHCIAIGYNAWTARDDGSRLDLVHHAWPLELVTWDANLRQLLTQVEPGTEPDGGRSSLLQPIVHGDGTWVVYQSHELHPWRQDAAILGCALVWAAHAFALRDWSRGSASHGNAKVIGTLPEGSKLQTKNDEGAVVLTEECEAMLGAVEDVAGLDQPSVVKAFGSEIQYLMNTSRAWEVWERLASSMEKAAAREYLGTDGTLGSMGGAPGVDISELFGVATTIVQGDITAITTGIRTGVIEPWGAVNYGDSSQVPARSYLIVDPDEQRMREELAKNEGAYTAAIQARRDAGFAVTQQWCDQLADQLGVARLELAATQASDVETIGADAGLLRGDPLIELSVPERFSLAIEGDLEQEPATLDALRSVPGQLLVSDTDGSNGASA